MQHAVVTGAAGFIGRALVDRLCATGVQTIAVIRESSSDQFAFSCTSIAGDIEQPYLLDELLTPDTTVFHMASHASVAGSVRDPRYDFGVNVVGTLEILESVRRKKASLVFPSSAAVYDPNSALPHKENAPRYPASPYGAAKLACESYVQAYSRCYDLNLKIARLFNAYGPGMTRFAIFDFYRKIKRDPKVLEILGDGKQIRDYLYIDDAINGLIQIAVQGQAGEDYNLASGEPVKTIELAAMVAKTMGFEDIEIQVKGETFPGDISQWYADIEKIKSIGFQNTMDLETGLKRTIEWFSTLENDIAKKNLTK